MRTPIALYRRLAGAVPLLSSLLLWVGCSTTIPDVDRDPPRVELRLTGPGIGTEVMSNPPLDNWVGEELGSPYLHLIPGRDYRFTASMSDAGGAETFFFAFPAAFQVSNVVPADAVVDTVEHTTQIYLEGNRADPRTGLIATGTLHIPETFDSHGPQSPDDFYFTVFGRDYGGRSGERNSTTMIIRLALEP